MKTKTLAVLGIVVLLAIAAAVGTFLLRTSTQIEEKNARAPSTPTEQQPVEVQPTIPPDSSNQSRVAIEQPAVVEETAPAANASAQPARNVPVTTHFVTDLSRFIIDHYHPEGSLRNPSSPGFSSLTFKQVNMRYGLDLIGLRHRSTEPDQARDEILSSLLNTTVLDLVYQIHAQRFLEALVPQGLGATKEFTDSGNGTVERQLTRDEVKEMLRLNAGLLDRHARVLDQLAASGELDTAVQRLFILEQAAVEANTRFSQARNEFDTLRREQKTQQGVPDNAALQEARQRMEEAGAAYMTAIKAREEARQEVLGLVDTDGQEALNDSRTLYLAKWVYRRLGQAPESRQALGHAASLLKDLADRMERLPL